MAALQTDGETRSAEAASSIRGEAQPCNIMSVAQIPGIKRNSGHRDYSRLSCGVGGTELEPRAKISAGVFAPALEVALDRAPGDVEGK